MVFHDFCESRSRSRSRGEEIEENDGSLSVCLSVLLALSVGLRGPLPAQNYVCIRTVCMYCIYVFGILLVESIVCIMFFTVSSTPESKSYIFARLSTYRVISCPIGTTN